MSDSYIQAPPDSTGKLIDTEQVTVGAVNVQRQRVNVMNFPAPPLPYAPLLASCTVGPGDAGDLAPSPGAGNRIAVYTIIVSTDSATPTRGQLYDDTNEYLINFTVSLAAPLQFNFPQPMLLADNNTPELENDDISATLTGLAIYDIRPA